MTIFICLDDADGLAFNHRRQSRDRVLCEHIAALSQKGVLRMNTSSFPLFSGINAPNICAEDDFMQHAQPNDFCFLECADPTVSQLCLSSHGVPLEPALSCRPAFFRAGVLEKSA